MKTLITKHSMITVCILCALLAGAALVVEAQEFRTHQVGNIRTMMFDNDWGHYETYGELFEWPALERFRTHGFSALTWITLDNFTDQHGDTHFRVAYGGQEDPHHIPIPGTFRHIVRHEPPEVIVDDLPQGGPFRGEVDPNLIADEMIETQYVHNGRPKDFPADNPGGGPGIWVTKRTYTFNNPQYADFIIFEYIYEVTRKTHYDLDEPDIPEQTLENVHFGYNFGFQVTEAGMRAYGIGGGDTNVWGDYMNVPAIISNRDSLTFTYVRNASNPRVGEYDSFGDPSPSGFVVGPPGRFLSESFVGFGPLHVDVSVADQSNDPNQPRTIDRLSRRDIWFGDAYVPYDAVASGERERGVHITDPGADPLDEDNSPNMEFQGYGPYTLQEGDQVRIVFALVFGGISQEKTIEYGQKWLNGEISDAEKNDILMTGLDSLAQNIDRAGFVWEQGLNVPSAPPSPNLTVSSGPDMTILEWEDITQRDFQGALDHYRVYRATGDFFAQYSLIYSGTETYFEDNNVSRGVPYYYYVTAVNTDGLESSRSQNRTLTSVTSFEPGMPTTANVRVVPNPYNITAGALNFGEERDRILFVNLPPIARLRIFTESGELVRTINHDNLTADYAWDQITDYNQLVSTGVYVLVVDKARDLDGNPLRDAIEKFVIIR